MGFGVFLGFMGMWGRKLGRVGLVLSGYWGKGSFLFGNLGRFSGLVFMGGFFLFFFNWFLLFLVVWFDMGIEG